MDVHYIIHALASKRNVVCTRSIYLPPTVTSQFSTLTCGLVKSTASLAGDAILLHANHIEVTLFVSIRVSELNTHKYLRERSNRKYILVYIHAMGYQLAISLISNWAGYIVAIHRPGVR